MDDADGRTFGLTPLTLADLPQFQRVLAGVKQPISDYSFANIFVWSSSLGLFWKQIHRHLCVFANGTGDLSMLLPPLAEPDASDHDLQLAVQSCFQIMNTYNRARGLADRSRIEYVSDEMLERLSAVCDGKLTSTSMTGDFVYPTHAIVELAGGDLKSRRHARSKFMREHPAHRTQPFTEADREPCITLLNKWHSKANERLAGQMTVDQSLETQVLRNRECDACAIALNHWQQLNLRGMTLWVGEQLVGFTFGEALSPLQASVLIEKTDPDFNGAAPYIFSEFCRQFWRDFPEVNAGDDWGIPSLRYTKASYRPSRMLNKYVISRPVESPSYLVPIASLLPYAQELLADSGEDERDQQTLRIATATDIGEILRLEQTCFDNPAERFSRRQVRYLMRDPRAVTVVAELRGDILGWAVGLVRRHRHHVSGRLYGLAVDPAARGRHLGRQLAASIITSLETMGAGPIYLEVRKDNLPARNLYKQLGFADYRDLPDYYGHLTDGLRMKRAQPVPVTA